MATYGYTSTYRATARGANAVIWTIGDSITRGAIPYGGSFVYTGGWRKYLYQALVAAGRTPTMIGGLANASDGLALSVAGSSHNGVNGANTANWVASYYGTYQPGLGATPTIVCLATGANDADTVGSAQSIGQLIDLVVASYPLANVVVSTKLPASPGTNSTINAQLVIEVNNRVRAGKHVQLVDGASSVTTSDLGDGLHPTEYGYRKLGDRWINAIMPLAG